MKSVIEETLAQAQANQRLFATRLVCLSKTGSKSPKVTDIRPITVTTLQQKIIEHILLNKLKLELGNTINRSQFGFRPGKETLMHIVRLLDRIKSHKQLTLPRMQQYLIFIDFSSAFDGIDHQILIDKIIHKGKCSKETLNLLKWYLNHINIRVNEDMIMQNKGSPQGGIRSPILWILYIDDLLVELENMADLRNVFAFADDLMIYCRSLPLAYKVARTILKWSQDNKIKVNTKKSAILPLAKTKRKTDKFDKNI